MVKLYGCENVREEVAEASRNCNAGVLRVSLALACSYDFFLTLHFPSASVCTVY